MFKGEVKVRIDAKKLAAEFSKSLSKADGAQDMFSSLVAQDTNEFVPMDSGMLAGSVLRASDFKHGLLVYDMPYARRLYYGDTFNFSQDKHPKAGARWFETAKSRHLDKWGRYIARILSGVWRRGR